MDDNKSDFLYSVAVLAALVVAGAVCVIKLGNPIYFVPLLVYIVAGYFFSDA